MIEVQIKEITKDDVEVYRDLRLEMVREHPYAFDVEIGELREKSLADWRFDVDGCVDNPYHNRFIAKTKFKNPVGIIGCLVVDDAVEIGGFYVQKHYNGKGIGKLLLAKAIEFGELSKVNKQRLWVSSESNVRKWYKKEGFRPTNPITVRNWHDGSQKEEMLVRKPKLGAVLANEVLDVL